MTDEMKERTEDTQSYFTGNIAWFLAGAFIGAAVAVLYAPKSGKETRQYLAGKVQQSKDAVSDTSSSIVEASRDMFERGKQLVEDAADLFERGRKLVKG
ncbi:MAG: YtxH domain-containing protein [Bryobacteraceae bacterium]|jgi:gas vesicle protein